MEEPTMRFYVLLALLVISGCGQRSGHLRAADPYDTLSVPESPSSALDLVGCDNALRPFVAQGLPTWFHLWAKWCFPCREVSWKVMSSLRGGVKDGRTDPDGVEGLKVVGFNIGDSRNAGLPSLCGHHGIPADLVYDAQGRMVLNTSVHEEPVLNYTGVVPRFRHVAGDEAVDEYSRFLVEVLAGLSVPRSTH